MMFSKTVNQNITVHKALSFLIAFILLITPASSQTRLDSIFNKFDPQQWAAAIKKKVSGLEEKLIAKSENTLLSLRKEEEKLYKKMLTSKDSITAKLQLEEVRKQYAALQKKLKNPSALVSASVVKDYIPYLDTLSSAFKFLSNQGGAIKDALSKVESLNGRLQQAVDIKQFIRERKEQLKQQLENLGLVKELKKFNKEVFYYAQQVKEYKEILQDPKKIEKKAMELLSKTKLFQDFMKKNSMLASLFGMPGDDLSPFGGAGGGPNLAGLQTRVQVNSLIQSQIAAGGPNAQQVFQQNIQEAQNQLKQLMDKVNKWGGGSSDDIMPEGFKPNSQKTKSFLKRLEYGTNIQSQKANSIFPVTSDMGLSLGYKLNDKSVIGFGASYKLGWGSGWNNIRITHQGVGLRSFIDWKLKGSFWVSGGYEQNYKPALQGVVISSPYGGSRMRAAWQQSGLIGMSKVFEIKSKLFKKTKLQLLWDFLSYQQMPRTQHIIFRIGYDLK